MLIERAGLEAGKSGRFSIAVLILTRILLGDTVLVFVDSEAFVCCWGFQEPRQVHYCTGNSGSCKQWTHFPLYPVGVTPRTNICNIARLRYAEDCNLPRTKIWVSENRTLSKPRRDRAYSQNTTDSQGRGYAM